MQSSTPQVHDEDDPLWTPIRKRRATYAGAAVVVLLLLVILPPYISISRYQRRVAAAISGELGRPVHFSSIQMHLLPLPGLTIKYLVVSELPEFGSEPVMVSDTVEARLRISSLWRRRIEVSRISMEAPSINLVRRTDTGRWNLQGIVTQASQITSAPTAQTAAGDAPRFPYIEATDARFNIKNGDTKMPFSVKEAQFSLWLPEPDEWHLRFSGKPVRTDTDVSDVGLLKVEATLGKGTSLQAAPIELQASWKPTPLGEAGKLTFGHDMGWRGEASAEASLKGTLALAKLTGDLHLLSLRRADFVPEHTAEINAHCEANTNGLLGSLHEIKCAVPTDEETSIFSAMEFLRRTVPSGHDLPDASAKPGVLLLRGDVPDVMHWQTVNLQASLKNAKANYALAWLRLFSKRIPRDAGLGGTLDLTAWKEDNGSSSDRWGGTLVCACTLPPPPAAKSDTTAGSETAPTSVTNQKANRWNLVLTYGALGAHGDTPAGAIAVNAYRPSPTDVGTEPVVAKSYGDAAVSGQLSRNGYTLIYSTRATAEQAAALLPPLGDGMPTPDTGTALEVQRPWGGPQTWTAATPAKPEPRSRRRR
ncbi:AsmA family protein [Terriglobus roseus]|uniref:AsmA protein n=1 Tax=Terriglobus roseus TaxID=392734 RepID=A0A1H4PUP2_9BACT|nr:AsmA family protein [Terriglobus roseus]SEC11099.1 AsmA protein [Terriglobus roseus]